VWTVYILKCIDCSIYVGCTSNLDERLKRHRIGSVRYTQTRLPIELIAYINFTDKYKAFEFEKYLKSGSGRAFMKKRFL
jgi:putative endonuclease